MCHKLSAYKKKEYELHNKIREISDELDRLEGEGKDTAEVFLQLETALEEFIVFRLEVKKYGVGIGNSDITKVTNRTQT